MSFASYAIVNGLNFTTIQEQLGPSHVTISIDTYCHLTDLKMFNKLM